MRLFVGIELSDEMKSAAADVAERLRASLTGAGLRVDARWIPAANLHITLWFIGDVDEARAACIGEALNAPFAVSPFPMRAAGLGAFPSSGPPRVFWIGLTTGAASLTAIHRQLESHLTPLGFEPERRPYSAHVTIARVKDVPRGSSLQIRRALAETTADVGASEVTFATLFRSHLSPKGSAYEPLLRIPLG